MLFGFLPNCSFFLFLLLAFSTLVQSQYCYFPDGSSVNADIPCPQVSSDPAFTFCCPRRDKWECLSNKLCNNTITGELSRGTCTDASWQSSSCPHFCVSNSVSGGVTVSLCKPSGLLCCSDHSGADAKDSCCDNVTNLFSLEAATATASSSQSSSPTTSGSLSPIHTFISASTTIDSSMSTSTPSGLPISAKAGIGAGVPVAVALLVLLAYLLYSNKRLHTQIKGQLPERNEDSQVILMNDLQPQMDLTRREYYELPPGTRPNPELP